MKPNIHTELYRAMQTAREEDIFRGAARQRVKGHPHRSAWEAPRRRVVAFLERVLGGASVTLGRRRNVPVIVPPLADNSPLPE